MPDHLHTVVFPDKQALNFIHDHGGNLDKSHGQGTLRADGRVTFEDANVPDLIPVQTPPRVLRSWTITQFAKARTVATVNRHEIPRPRKETKRRISCSCITGLIIIIACSCSSFAIGYETKKAIDRYLAPPTNQTPLLIPKSDNVRGFNYPHYGCNEVYEGCGI